jgi:nucleolar GTP-binding protein
MNFQDLAKIEDASWYLDKAFKHARLMGEKVFPSTSGDPFSRMKTTEFEKLKTFSITLTGDFENIVKKYPSIDNMPEFYLELLRATLDYDFLKQSLGAINWAESSLKKMWKSYEWHIKKSPDKKSLQKTIKEYYGRMSSIVKQVDKNLQYLDESRTMMRSYPTLKTDLFTVVITGFPNIGKSTLLSKITPAKPEIKNYAFTTKGLNQGYATYGFRKVQFVDTPGVLNRTKRNAIEEQAYLVMKYLANLVVYIIDLTETYDLKKQETLLKELKEYDKPIIVYLSKSDIIDKKLIAKYKKKYAAVSTLDALNKKIKKALKEHYFE